MRTDLRLAMIVCVVGALLAGDRPAAIAEQAAPAKGRIVAEGCLVSLIDDRSVPAKEAGALVKVNVKEGEEVHASSPKLEQGVVAAGKSTPLAVIESDIAMDQRDVAAAARDRALADAKNRVSIEYAESLRDVAASQLKMYERAIRRKADSISEIELLKAQQELKAAELRVRQAEHEFAQFATTAIEKEAELRAVERSLGHREIHSPIDGVVVEVYAQEGEWVKPGDAVFRVVNLRRLRVQATLNHSEASPSDVVGREIAVECEASGGARQSFTGKVVFVHPEIKAGGRFNVWAEVENRKDARGHYQLLPGTKATMTVAAAEPTH